MKRLLILILTLFMIIMFTSCGGENNDKNIESDESGVPQGISLVIIAGKHANANMFSDDTIRIAKELIKKAYEYKKDGDKLDAIPKISIIVSDGIPSKEHIEGRKTISDEVIYNEAILLEEVNDDIDTIIKFLKSDELKAEEEEVDLLAALSEAKVLLDQNSGVENHILILDTGICTAGYASMVRSRPIEANIDNVANFIDSIPEEGFPELNGTKVTFLGMGNVSLPQEDMRSNNQYKKWLINVWSTIIKEKCNAELTVPIMFSDANNNPLSYLEDGSGYPRVKTVYFKKPEIKEVDLSGSEYAPKITLQSAELNFVRDSADFIDPSEASRVIGNKIDEINRFIQFNPAKKIYIVGSIAETEFNQEPIWSHDLSKDRADKVAGILINEYAVPADIITVIDAGTTKFSWRPGGEFSDDGSPNESNKQNSRVVAIIGETAESEVGELRANGYIE